MNNCIVIFLFYLSIFGTYSGDFEFSNQEKILDSYSLYRTIEDGGEEYLFEFLYLDRTDEKKDKYDLNTNTLKVVVKNKHNEVIDAVNVNVANFYPESYHITDFNFDGYKDILFLLNRENAKANHAYYGAIWNPKQNKFVSVEMPWPNLAIDRKSQRLLTISANSASSHTYAIYKVQNDKIILENSLTTDVVSPNEYKEYNIDEKTDKRYWHYLESEFDEDGNEKIVNDIVSYYGDENTPKVEELYCSENSKWDLAGLKFYQSDYGSGLGFYDTKTNEPIDVHLDLGYDEWDGYVKEG